MIKMGKKIKLERIQNDWNINEIAKQLDVSPQSISNIEKSESMPIVIKYLSFFKERGIDINKFF